MTKAATTIGAFQETLTSGAEANLLKFKELNKKLTDEDIVRWEEIKQIFMKQQKLKGFGQNNQMGQVLEQVEVLNETLENIRVAVLAKKTLVMQKDKDKWIKDDGVEKLMNGLEGIRDALLNGRKSE